MTRKLKFLIQHQLFGLCILGILGAAQAAPELLAHWSFDSTLANTYYDVTRHGYDASSTGLSLANGVVGKALQCPGQGFELIAKNSKTAFNQKQFTIETWINVASSPLTWGQPRKIFNFQYITSGVRNGYSLSINESARVETGMPNPSGSDYVLTTSTTEILPDTWYHIAVTFDETMLRVFVNGALEGSVANTGYPLCSADARIGCQTLQEGTVRYHFVGLIDELKFYNYALSESAILGNYNKSKPVDPPVVDEVVAHWTFDSTLANTYYDVTGHGHDASSAGLGIADGVVGKALQCPGKGFELIAANSKNAFNLKRFTIESWISSNSSPSSWGFPRVIFNSQYITTGIRNGYTLIVDQSGFIVAGMSNPDGSDYAVATGKTAILSNNWYHIAATFDESMLRIYVNGILEDSVSNTGYSPSLADARIGCQTLQEGLIYRFFDGRIDELKLYNYALSASIVLENYNKSKPVDPPVVDEVVAHWSFDSTRADTYYDVTGHGYDASSAGLSVADGVVGKALQCPGQNFELIASNSKNAFNLKRFSIETWINIDNTLASWPLPGKIFDFQHIAPGIRNGYSLHVTPQGIVEMGSSTPNGSDWKLASSVTPVQAGRWYHIAATFDSSSISLYINGVFESSAANSGYVPPLADARIGCQTLQSGEVRCFYKGLIDELKLYDYALDAQSIAAHYTADKPADPIIHKVNLGMQTITAKPGDVIWMPVFVSNYDEALKIAACKFSLQIDTSVISFIEATVDSGLAPTWLLASNGLNADSLIFGMGGEEHTLGYGDGELLRCKFRVKPSAAFGAYSAIFFDNVVINEDAKLLITTTSGKINVANSGVKYGDVTGNGAVNVLDGAKILQYVVGALVLPDASVPNFSPKVADVSGDGTISSYDAALVFQYSVGLISQFPVETKSAVQKRAVAAAVKSIAQLSFELSENSNDQTVFKLSGDRLRGFISGEFTVEYNPAIANLVSGEIVPSIRNAVVKTYLDRKNNRLNIAMTTNDRIDIDSLIDLVEIVLPPVSSTSSQTALVLRTALINEGKITTNVPPGGLITGPGDTPAGLRMGPLLTCDGLSLRIQNFARAPVLVTIYNLLGQVQFSESFAASTPETVVSLKRFTAGLYLARTCVGKEILLRTIVVR
jgi:hypothetical protein